MSIEELNNADLLRELFFRWFMCELTKSNNTSQQNSNAQIFMALNDQKEKIKDLEDKIMAQFSEVLQAIESTGLSIISTINKESVDIVKQLEAAKAQNPDASAQFDQIISSIQGMGIKVSDAVSGLVPTIESPVSPAPVPAPAPAPSDTSGSVSDIPTPAPTPEPAPAPVPTPTPVPDNMPNPDVPVEVTPSPSGVGVNGGSNIDLTPSTGA